MLRNENKINELGTNSKNESITNCYKTNFKKSQQPRINLLNDENGNVLGYSCNILNGWKNYSNQLLYVHGVNEVWND
jgi:hypothetical protein